MGGRELCKESLHISAVGSATSTGHRRSPSECVLHLASHHLKERSAASWLG